MAASPTIVAPVPNKLGSLVDMWTITFPTTTDSSAGGTSIIEVSRPYSMSLHYESTNWNSKTLTFFGGNDGTHFYVLGTAISVTANGAIAIATRDLGFRFYQAIFSGAPTGALTLTIVVNRLGH